MPRSVLNMKRQIRLHSCDFLGMLLKIFYPPKLLLIKTSSVENSRSFREDFDGRRIIIHKTCWCISNARKVPSTVPAILSAGRPILVLEPRCMAFSTLRDLYELWASLSLQLPGCQQTTL